MENTMTSPNRFLFFVTFSIGMILSVLQSTAAELPGRTETIETKGGWEVSVSPYYGFVTGIKGNLATARAGPVSVNLTPLEFIKNIRDIVDALDHAVIGAFEVRKGRFAAAFDLYSISVTGGRDLRGILFSSASLSQELTVATGLGSYRLFSNGRAHVDGLAGARLWNTKFEFALTPGALARGRTFQDGRTWVDPVIGLSGRYDITDRLYAKGQGIVGGLASSDVTWDASATIGFEVIDEIDLYAGFRSMGVDFNDKGFVFDMNYYGPIIGGVLKF